MYKKLNEFSYDFRGHFPRYVSDFLIENNALVSKYSNIAVRVKFLSKISYDTVYLPTLQFRIVFTSRVEVLHCFYSTTIPNSPV